MKPPFVPIVIVADATVAMWLRSNPIGDITDPLQAAAALITAGCSAYRWPLVPEHIPAT